MTAREPLPFHRLGEGAPVLLVHGTAAGAACWESVQPLLARSFSAIAYDRRTFGAAEREAKAPSGGYAAHGEDAAAVLAECGGEPAWIVGWSSGGIVALHLALAQPDLVKGIVFLETPLHGRSHFDLRLMAGFAAAMILKQLGRERAGATAFLRGVASERGLRNGMDRLSERQRDLLCAPAAAVLAELRHGTGEELTADQLRTVRCPMTWVIGERSGAFYTAAADEFRSYAPHVRREIAPDTGHMMLLEKPELVTRLIVEAIEAGRA